MFTDNSEIQQSLSNPGLSRNRSVTIKSDSFNELNGYLISTEINESGKSFQINSLIEFFCFYLLYKEYVMTK